MRGLLRRTPVLLAAAATTAVCVPAAFHFSASSSEQPRRWGVNSIQGLRDYQEDRYVVQQHDGVGELYAVFDGHGGPLTSETAKQTFAQHFFHRFGEANASGAPLKSVWEQTFQDTEESYRKVSEGRPDSDGAKRTEGREGSTANAVFIRGNRLSSANAGDSRCVICQKNGTAVAMSVDHKPTDATEFIRLQENGFRVVRGRIYRADNGRGGLNLSRALGDFLYEKGVPCTPDVFVKTLTDQDELLILGTDGLWDALSNQHACKIARAEKDPKAAAAELTRLALMHGSSDNITAIVVDLLGGNGGE